MKTKKNMLLQSIIFFPISLTGFLLLGCFYIKQCARNVVFMDFWKIINILVDPIMNGQYPWIQMWEGPSAHRNFFEMLLLSLNIKYMGLNCIWESYAGIIVIGISCCVLYFVFFKQCSTNALNKSQNLMKQMLFLPVMLCLFNLNQWEILSIQSSFSFMLRILGYIVQMLFLNNLLQDSKARLSSFVIAGVYTAILIDLISQLYWPALVIVNGLMWGIHIYRNHNINIKRVLAFWVPVICAICLYLYHLDMAADSNSLNSFIQLMLTGELWIAILYMLAGSIIPQTKLQ